jgi:methionine aminopeptidase
MHRQSKKSEQEMQIMAEGGRIMASVKKDLRDAVAPGVSAWEIEEMATKKILVPVHHLKWFQDTIGLLV